VSDQHLLNVLDGQARACASLGSPMYGQLLARIIDDIRAGGAFSDVLASHEDDPGPSALALRLLGGLHRLVLDGRASSLRRWYPSTGGEWDAEAAWSDVVDVAREHIGPLRAALDRPPQTNEVGRSAALVGALLILTRRFPLPIRLFEIGASAGLNLRADHYLYRFTGGQWGPAGSAVVVDDAWRGRRPPDVSLRIIERHGFDIAPVDAVSDDGRLTLLSYVWPDMPDRLQRLVGAIGIARRVPAGLDRMSAADAVHGLRVVHGTLTVLWHSVTWQYLTAGERAQVNARMAALGATADATKPLVWLSLEQRRRTPGAAHEFQLRARCWPDGTDEVLGVSAPHGPPVIWE
jgi:hypothetical protein